MIDKSPAVARRSPLRGLAFVAGCVASLALAASASAAPTGEYVNFAQCPTGNSAVTTCVYAQTTGGEFDIGSTAVPLKNAETLQGGLERGEEGFYNLVPALNGETLSKTPQTVPGGLLKIVAPESWPSWLQAIFNEFINEGLTGVTATTELVGTARLAPLAVLSGKGTALELPVRVHLENPFLGGGCYVGSASNPITVALTSGTTSPPPPNEPITGSPGTHSFRAGGTILVISEDSLVNNSFAAPEAEGCGGIFSFLVDPAVDAEVGLPSAAGHNTAILNGFQEVTSATAVRKSEA